MKKIVLFLLVACLAMAYALPALACPACTQNENVILAVDTQSADTLYVQATSLDWPPVVYAKGSNDSTATIYANTSADSEVSGPSAYCFASTFSGKLSSLNSINIDGSGLHMHVMG